MPRASGATWNRSRPMRGSFWSAWKSRRWTRSTASRRPSPSGRRTPPQSALHRRDLHRVLRLSAPALSRASGRRSAPTAARACARTRWMRSAARMLRTARGLALVRAVSGAANTPDAQALRDHLFELRKKGFNRLFQSGQTVRVLHARIAARHRFRASRCSCWWIASRSRPTCISGWSIPSKSATAKPAK